METLIEMVYSFKQPCYISFATCCTSKCQCADFVLWNTLTSCSALRLSISYSIRTIYSINVKQPINKINYRRNKSCIWCKLVFLEFSNNFIHVLILFGRIGMKHPVISFIKRFWLFYLLQFAVIFLSKVAFLSTFSHNNILVR